MDTLEQRVQYLECELHRSRRVNRVFTSAVVVIVLIAGAQGTKPSGSKPTTPKKAPSSETNQLNGREPSGKGRVRVLEAEQFVLVDRLGRSRAKMMVTNEGPALSMFDEQGKKRLELSHTTNGSGLRVLNSNEAAVVSLQVPRDVDLGCLEINNSQGRSMTKASGFSVQDRDHQGRLQLALLNGNFPVLGISESGQAGPPSVEITASDDGSRRLKLHDAHGHTVFSVFAAENGATHLNMRHPDHERSLQISTGSKDVDGPVIAFFAPTNEDDSGGILPRLKLGLRTDRQSYIRVSDKDGASLFTAP